MKSNTFTTDTSVFLQRLKTLALKSEIVYAIGKLPAERVISVAIIGTRRPTAYGKKVSFDFGYTLAQQGIIIVSGLAYGVDVAAHKGALAAGGTTIAVLAHGLDSVYPTSHRHIAHEIVENGGCLLSTYPDGTPPMKHQFLERNQIVSGLADAVIVIEAGKASGTSSTVQYALEQNKEVFAVPGPIDSSMSEGTNTLIQQGAHPALHPQDILDQIAPGRVLQAVLPTGDTPAETQVLQLLYKGMANTQQLTEAVENDSRTFAQIITLLEIRGRVRRDITGHWQLIK